MTRFTLQEALGSETNYNHLFDGSNPQPMIANDTNLKLVDANFNSILIVGQGLTYSTFPAAIIGGDVLWSMSSTALRLRF